LILFFGAKNNGNNFFLTKNVTVAIILRRIQTIFPRAFRACPAPKPTKRTACYTQKKQKNTPEPPETQENTNPECFSARVCPCAAQKKGAREKKTEGGGERGFKRQTLTTRPAVCHSRLVGTMWRARGFPVKNT